MEKVKKKRRRKSHPAAIAFTVLFAVVAVACLSFLIYTRAKEIAYSERPLVLLVEDNVWHEVNTGHTMEKTERLLDEKGWRYKVKTVPVSEYVDAQSIARLISESCVEYNPTVLILAPDFTAILGAGGRKLPFLTESDNGTDAEDNTVPDLTSGRFRPLFVGIGQNHRMNMFDMVFTGDELDGWDKVASILGASEEKIAFVYNSDNDYANGVHNIFTDSGADNIRSFEETGKDFVKKIGDRLQEEETSVVVVPYLSEFASFVNELNGRNFRFVTDEIHSILLSGGAADTYGILMTDMPALTDSITNDVVLPYRPGRNIVLPLPKIFEVFSEQ